MHVRMKFRRLILVCAGAGLVALLSSCAAPNIKPDYSLTEAQKEAHGLLIGVITANTRKTTFSFDVRFFFQPNDNQPVLLNFFQLNTDCISSDPSNLQSAGTCTHLIAIDLPAGQYTLTDWKIFSAGFFPYSVDPLVWWPQQFSILPGKATYIGHIFMDIKYEHSKIGHDVRDGWPEITNQHDADIPLLLKQYPLLNQNQILYDILVFPPRGRTIMCPCP